MTFFRKTMAALAAAMCLAACTTVPAEQEDKSTTIYVNPDTGEYAVDESASDEVKMLAGLLSMAARGELDPDLPDEEILSADAAGNITHLQSGLSCPKTWARFALTDTQIYKQNGQDAGCSYEDGHGAILTLYAYQSSMTVGDELAGIMEGVVKQRHPIHEEAGMQNLTDPTSATAFMADAISYKGGDGRPMKSGLALADYAGWRIKARVTYPEAIADELERFVNVVMLGEYDQVTARQQQLDAIEAAADDML